MNPGYQSLPTAEEALIKIAAQGSLEAFNELVLRYQNLAYHQAYTLLGESTAAEDITQESFIKAFRSLRSFRCGSFRAWLLRIVSNTAYDLLRQSRHHFLQPLFPEDDEGEEIETPAWLVDPSASVEKTVEQNEQAQRIYELLNELPEIHRRVITLVDIHGLEYWEAAEVLGVPVGTVKSRLARARLQMKAKIEGNGAFFFPITRPVPAVHC